MKKLKQLKKDQGFTIIEVMIVLAIAALILLVVFLAVPSLQRSQRNNARKNEASRLSSAVIEAANNDPSGALPSSTTQCSSLIAGIGTLSGFSSLSATCAAAAATQTAPGPSLAYLATNEAATTTAAAAKDTVLIAEQSTCGSTGGSTMTFVAGSSKNVSVAYTTESGGSNYIWQCINAQ